MRRTARAAAAVLAPALLVSACSDDGGGGGGGDGPSAEEVLEAARATLDETSGVAIKLSTDDLPDGVTGVQEAEGVGTHEPAFEGSITVPISGSTVEVPVVAVDGTVYAEVPLVGTYQEVDPGEYGAPDPADLLSTEDGLSSLLTEATDLDDQGEARNEDDPDEILRTISGTVAGSVVEAVIPSAEGDFDATFEVADGDELRRADLTGVFYPDTEEMTYTITFDDYGAEPDITAP